MTKKELKELIDLCWQQFHHYQNTRQFHKADQMKHKIKQLIKKRNVV